MKHDSTILAVLAIVAAVTPSLTERANAQTSDDDEGNANAGQALYFEHACYSCHGYTGETGVRALVGSGFLFSPEVFTSYLRLRADQNPMLPSTQMPNYPEESLSDAEARDLFAYIRTFESNTPALDEIPVLNAILDAAEQPDEP